MSFTCNSKSISNQSKCYCEALLHVSCHIWVLMVNMQKFILWSLVIASCPPEAIESNNSIRKLLATLLFLSAKAHRCNESTMATLPHSKARDPISYIIHYSLILWFSCYPSIPALSQAALGMTNKYYQSTTWIYLWEKEELQCMLQNTYYILFLSSE